MEKFSYARKFGCALLGTLLLGAVGWASAVPITDTVNPTDTLITFGATPSPCPSGFTCSTSQLAFNHVITDNGFVVGIDSVTSATIAIHLTDVGGAESYQFILGASEQTFNNVNVPGGVGSTDTFSLIVPSIFDLNVDGILQVAVKSTAGSFSFADSVLIAQVTKGNGGGPSNGIPEPGSVLLLGSGLAGLVLASRRRNKNS